MTNFTTTSSSVLSGINNYSNSTTAPALPWANKHEAQKVVELIYLSLLAVVGSLGNLIVIFSIILEKRIHAHGNIFVVNLAIADLLITGFVVPTVMVNVVMGRNGLAETVCTVAGYTVTVTCTCSLCNLTLIAVNRFYAVVRQRDYMAAFTRRRVYIMILGTWVWSNLLSLPTLVGWGRIAYDEKIELCSWDDDYNLSYTFFLTIFAIVIPLIIIFTCYGKLFCTVRNSGKWVRSISVKSGSGAQIEQNRRSIRKERNLLTTLAMTVAFFCVCWLPYGFAILIDARNVAATPKKIFGWLGLSNSAVNFVIYGVMNPVFRRGYKNLIVLLFLCKRKSEFKRNGIRRISTHSDSFFRSAQRRKSNPSNLPTGTPKTEKYIRTNSNDILKQGNMNSDGSLPKCFTPLTCRKRNDLNTDENPRKISMEVSSLQQSSLFDCMDNYPNPESFFKRDKKEIEDFLKEMENKRICDCRCPSEKNLQSDDKPFIPQLRRSHSECRSKTKFLPLQRYQSESDVTMTSLRKLMSAKNISNHAEISALMNNNNKLNFTPRISVSSTNSENSRSADFVKEQEKPFSAFHEGLHQTVKTMISIVIQDSEGCNKQNELSKL